MARLAKGGPLFECQAQIRIRQWTPSMGMRRRELSPLDSKMAESLYFQPADASPASDHRSVVWARRMLIRKADVESVIIGGQIPCRGNPTMPGNKPDGRPRVAPSKTHLVPRSLFVQTRAPHGLNGLPCWSISRFRVDTPDRDKRTCAGELESRPKPRHSNSRMPMRRCCGCNVQRMHTAFEVARPRDESNVRGDASGVPTRGRFKTQSAPHVSGPIQTCPPPGTHAVATCSSGATNTPVAPPSPALLGNTIFQHRHPRTKRPRTTG